VVFAELVGALEGKRSEVNTRTIDDLRALWSKCSFEEFLSALEAFDAAPPHAGVSSIHDKFRRRVRDVEEKNLQLERDVGVLQQAVGNLRRAISRLADENMAQQQEKDALYKQHDELVGRFAQAQSKSGDAVKRILQEIRTSRKQNHEPCPQNQFLFNNRREKPLDGAIWQQMISWAKPTTAFCKRGCEDETPWHRR
jgi:regulator of replication initiation timing